MKTSKIVIKNLFGIRETTLDGKSVEISGPKGAGKTSVLDAIRFALTNRSERDCIVHQGADEGEIIIETTTGLSIDRKALPAKSAGTVKVRDGSLLQTRPAEFLSQIFTPLQLNPVEFTQLSRQEKNRVILSLIEFDWDVNWIREQFGEIPQGVDYSKHILEVLNDIQAENGVYFQSRQNINRDIRNKQAFISEEVVAGLAWNGDAFIAMQENPDLEFIVPEEGMLIWLDNFAIPAGAEHKENAYKFISYLMRPEVAKLCVEEFNYSTPNKAAEKILEPEYAESKVIVLDPEELAKGEVTVNVGKARELYEKYWEQLKAGD